MRPPLPWLVVALLILLGCRARGDEQAPHRARARGDTVRSRDIVRLPYTTTELALSDFRPQMPLGSLTGGRCREDPYRVDEGLRGVVWRAEGPDRRFWEIRVAIDSAGTPRHYFEDRYGDTIGRTMISVDFDAGHGRVRNSTRGVPAQTAAGTADAVFHALNLDDPSAQASRVLERCRTWLEPWGVIALLPESLAPPPEPRPAPRVPTVDRSFRNADLGVGFLRAVAAPSPRSSSFVGWLRQLILPLHERPGAPPAAWMARGWLALPAGSRWTWKELALGGWIVVGYDAPASLPVLEMRDDGWFRFRYLAPGDSADGTAWAHRSELELGDVALSIRRWEDHFLHLGSPTYIAERGPHPLRNAPSDNSDVIDSLDGRGDDLPGNGVSALEVRGDWMKVRVQWPGGWCGTTAQRTAEGWIRWRSIRRGPILALNGVIC